MVATASLFLLLVVTPALAFVHQPSKALVQQHVENSRLVTYAMFEKKKDCGKKLQPIAMTQWAAKVFKLNETNPGAGIEPDMQKRYGSVMKDGFYEVDCVKDYMYHHGDAVGPNKHEYKLDETAGVSIVHYTDLVPKEDRKKMTPEVCFNFCRTVPEMLFFGLTAGRECYCEPYFKPMAGDSSQCDAVCEGKPTSMCGGMKKTSVYQMHFCDSTAGDLASRADKAGAFLSEAEGQHEAMMLTADHLQSAAEAGQGAFGPAGDTVMSNLCQSAKVYAGEFQHKLEESTKLGEELKAAVDAAKGLDGADFTDPATMKEAENAMKKMDENLPKCEDLQEECFEMNELATGEDIFKKPDEDAKGDVKGENEEKAEALKQFHPTMYFVDREYESMPSTCGGEVLNKPMVVLDAETCAAVCSREGIACAGFSYVSLEKADNKMCFLFSKMKSITYYTGCKKELFLQQAKSSLVKDDAEGTMCYAKFSSFVGTTLKPDPSGKCDLCLKTADKAQRCFE